MLIVFAAGQDIIGPMRITIVQIFRKDFGVDSEGQDGVNEVGQCGGDVSLEGLTHVSGRKNTRISLDIGSGRRRDESGGCWLTRVKQAVQFSEQADCNSTLEIFQFDQIDSASIIVI